MDQFSNDPFIGIAADDAAAQRNGARDSLLLTAHLRLAGEQAISQVRVRNLSSGGLMAEYQGLITSGAPIEVDVRGVGWVAGRVAWVTDGRIGIAFDREIDPLLARKPIGGGPRPAFKRPPLPRY